MKFDTYFLPFQQRWINDPARLKIIEKSRQIGITHADAYDSVRRVAGNDARLDVWVSSRDETQAQLYLQHCRTWANVLKIVATDLGQVLINRDKEIAAFAMRFANGRSIYALSSNPDAIVGKTGHIKLDEYALQRDQPGIYGLAYPCTLWGGTLSIISTHRGPNTFFYNLLQQVKHGGNPYKFSHHCVTLQDAIAEGLVEKINAVTGLNETREEFAARLRRECGDEAQYLQEFCCIPADNNSAFLSYDLIRSCEEPGCLKDLAWIRQSPNAFYVGFDVARNGHLSVIDVGEKIGDVIWDRLRIEMRNKTFGEMEAVVASILELPQVTRICIDATGLGMGSAERLKERFGWKVEPITMTAQLQEHMAYELRRAFEEKLVRIDADPKLREDLHGVNTELTPSGHTRFAGETRDSHCDRFWAKALRQWAASRRFGTPGIAVA
jgi:phage FluMu gp28-like protein